MPRLWSDTIDAHRREVRDAIVNTTAALAEDGLLSVTMSQIAEQAGIGRATLYKYFPDIESILVAWHEREITAHLEQLAHARDQASDPAEQLEAVLTAFALSHRARAQHDNEVAALLHRQEHVGRAEQQLRGMIRDLLAQGAQSGIIRSDVEPDELAGYCLHAVTAACGLPSEAAVARLVTVILAGIHLPSAATPPPRKRQPAAHKGRR